MREAEILFTLKHPHIVKVTNLYLDASPPYLEMEFAAGHGLDDLIAQGGGLAASLVLRLGRELTAALAYMHEKGVSHRDIKPANLIISSDGVVKLVDFGLAIEQTSERITQTQMAFGTVSYAPPEWIDPSRLAADAWDLYSLGVVLYEALTGRDAFPLTAGMDSRRQAFQVMAVKQATPFLDPGPEVPEGLRDLVRRLTARDPDERPASAAIVARHLETIEHELSGPVSAEEAWLEVRDATVPPASRRVPEMVGATPQRSAPGQLSLLTRGTIAAGVFLALFAIGALGLIIVAALFTGQTEEAPSPTVRTVEIEVRTDGAAAPFQLVAAGRAVDSSSGLVHRFEGVPLGELEVRWAAGEGCRVDACPGESCPVFCEQGTVTQVVEASHEPLRLPLIVKAPAARPVEMRIFGPSTPTVLIAGDTRKSEDGTLKLAEMLPGVYEVLIWEGACPEPVVDCSTSEEGCPSGCRTWATEIVVPAGRGRFTATLDLSGEAEGEWPVVFVPVPPAPTETETGPASSADAVETEDVAAVWNWKPDGSTVAPTSTKDDTRMVSREEFSAWLMANPDWQPEPQRAQGGAGTNYLAGWTGARPPSPISAPVQSVSWSVAMAFCSMRGGLQSTMDKPRRWSLNAENLRREWRDDGGRAAIRTSNGRVRRRIGADDVVSGVGFRCVKPS